MLVIAGQTAGPNWLNFFDETHDETSACNIYTVCLKYGGKGCTDSVVLGFSRLRPFLKSWYNFRFNEPNPWLVDLKITIVL